MRKGTRNWLLGTGVIVLALLSPKLFAAFDAARPVQVQPAPTIKAVSTTDTNPNHLLSGLVRYEYDFAGSSAHWQAEITEFDSLLNSAAASSPVSHAVSDLTLTYTGDHPEAVRSVGYNLYDQGGGYIRQSEAGLPLNPSHSVHRHDPNAAHILHSSDDTRLITVAWNGHTEKLSLRLKHQQSSQTKSNQAGIVVHSHEQFQSLVNKVKTEHPGVDPAGQAFTDIEEALQGSAVIQYLGRTANWSGWAQYLAENDEIVCLPDATASHAPADVVLNRPPAESFNCLTQEITFTSAFELTDPPQPATVKYQPSVQKDAFCLVFSNVTNPQKDLLSHPFYVGTESGLLPYWWWSQPVSSGQMLALLCVGHGEIQQTGNNGANTQKYMWEKGVAQATFAPNWNDHGTVVSTYAHTWNQTVLEKAQPRLNNPDRVDIQFSGGTDHLTANSPQGIY